MNDFFVRLTWPQWLLAAFGRHSEPQYNEPMPVEPTEERLYSVPEAAELLSKSEQSVRNLCIRGRLAARQVGRTWLIPQSSIDSFEPQPRGKHVTKP